MEDTPTPLPEGFSDVKHLKGKYEWSSKEGEAKKAEGAVQAGTIDKYGWADGTKNVSIYVDVADDVPEDAISLDHTAESVTLTVQDKRLRIPKLAHDISEARMQRKPGKNQLVIKLIKKEVHSWTKLAGEIVNPNSGCYTADDVKKRVVSDS
mmetsp:Transcript_94154/g.167466  ORF Transcript_94154/g.167466 Transcript_94154/m.167466 type:complete len:152 (+) Transcript_94154:98-553(+)|eukprot:CAMPEP_0197627878 /NCGR_PEP_ID=MMETSP1338-20131121/6366_1 /TAXON_ID=43686 ORGANISM="Pelagodinium beii, Strain RCC1491" /NCGR_SAMPLE_ID=MMETSP1338 /ASSEMBLY_ACC=CAM_ASM_000754 /LENGTH=151 /DNA_ID=CAMNT_0043198717 /DNA_START=95 /DNA_END=550 /DNA_ORIENTATION=+